jgi:hypothetical protein
MLKKLLRGAPGPCALGASLGGELGAHPEVGSGWTYVEKALEEEHLGHAHQAH